MKWNLKWKFGAYFSIWIIRGSTYISNYRVNKIFFSTTKNLIVELTAVVDSMLLHAFTTPQFKRCNYIICFRGCSQPFPSFEIVTRSQGCQVPKNKKAKFGHKRFQKGQIFKEILPKYFWQSVSKRPNGNSAMKI